VQELEASLNALERYQVDCKAPGFFSLLPASCAERPTSSCLLSTSFGWFPHVVVAVQTVEQLKARCLKYLSIATSKLDAWVEKERRRISDRLAKSKKRHKGPSGNSRAVAAGDNAAAVEEKVQEAMVRLRAQLEKDG
jgi:hypothetical protein